MNLKKYIVSVLSATLLVFSANALEVYDRGFRLHDSPIDSFTSPKHWMFFNNKTQSFIIQTYLPNFKKENIEFEIKERLTGGLKVRVVASQWKDIPVTATGSMPTKVLMSFDESTSLPIDIQKSLITSRFDGEILTIVIPKKEEGSFKVSF